MGLHQLTLMYSYMVPAVVCMLIFLGFALPAYTGRNFGAVVVLLTLYGFSITPAMYICQLFFTVPSTAYVILICVNLFIGITATLTTFILELFPEDEGIKSANEVLLWVFLIFPNYCMGRGLVELARNEYLAQYQEFTANFFGGETTFKVTVQPVLDG